jgi:hypothetical protein
MSTWEKKNNQSEIALLFQEWNREMGLIQQDILAYAVTARHDFITKRMRAFGAKHVNLLEVILANRDVQETVSQGVTQEVQE